jgi:hypothetical protein
VTGMPTEGRQRTEYEDGDFQGLSSSHDAFEIALSGEWMPPRAMLYTSIGKVSS